MFSYLDILNPQKQIRIDNELPENYQAETGRSWLKKVKMLGRVDHNGFFDT